jgi:hypothetical protein
MCWSKGPARLVAVHGGGGDTRRSRLPLPQRLVQRSRLPTPERITLGDRLLERWSPTKKLQFRPSTFASYRNNVETHINPRIGHIALQKRQPEDLDTFYAQLLVDGRRNGKGGGLAPRTCESFTASSARRSPTR